MLDVWKVLEIVAPILTAIFIFWMDIRTKVTAIETKLEPIWTWWNGPSHGTSRSRRRGDLNDS